MKTETHFEEEGEEPDRGNFLAAQSHRHPPELEIAPPMKSSRPTAPIKSRKPSRASATKPPARPAPKGKPAAKDRGHGRASKGGKTPGRSRKRRAG